MDTSILPKEGSILIHTERGLSLVEILVTLAILSIAGTIMWSIFFQGSKISQTMVTKNSLQQEANLVVTRLTKIHQTSEDYRITAIPTDITNCKGIKISSNKPNTPPSTPPKEDLFNNDGMCYSFLKPLQIDNSPSAEDPYGFKFEPSIHDYSMTLTISEKTNSDNSVSINVFLYRLK